MRVKSPGRAVTESEAQGTGCTNSRMSRAPNDFSSGWVLTKAADGVLETVGRFNERALAVEMAKRILGDLCRCAYAVMEAENVTVLNDSEQLWDVIWTPPGGGVARVCVKRTENVAANDGAFATTALPLLGSAVGVDHGDAREAVDADGWGNVVDDNGVPPLISEELARKHCERAAWGGAAPRQKAKETVADGMGDNLVRNSALDIDPRGKRLGTKVEDARGHAVDEKRTNATTVEVVDVDSDDEVELIADVSKVARVGQVKRPRTVSKKDGHVDSTVEAMSARRTEKRARVMWPFSTGWHGSAGASQWTPGSEAGAAFEYGEGINVYDAIRALPTANCENVKVARLKDEEGMSGAAPLEARQQVHEKAPPAGRAQVSERVSGAEESGRDKVWVMVRKRGFRPDGFHSIQEPTIELKGVYRNFRRAVEIGKGELGKESGLGWEDLPGELEIAKDTADEFDVRWEPPADPYCHVTIVPQYLPAGCGSKVCVLLEETGLVPNKYVREVPDVRVIGLWRMFEDAKKAGKGLVGAVCGVKVEDILESGELDVQCDKEDKWMLHWVWGDRYGRSIVCKVTV